MRAVSLLLILASAIWGADEVQIEMMTYAEVYKAIHEQGKTTVLVYNGGSEQRGPRAVLGGHTIMTRWTREAIARRLGNALVAPVLAFPLADGYLNPNWPGTASLSPDSVLVSVAAITPGSGKRGLV